MPTGLFPSYHSSIGEHSLLTLLHNPLVLSYIVPNLPETSILALASTSHSFRSLMYSTYPGITFRYIDLSSLPSLLLRADINSPEGVIGGIGYWHTTDDMLSVDDYYATPLRRVFYVFKKNSVLGCVTTLILDGLVVPAALLREILCDEPYNVRILSLRGVKNLADQQLMQVLRYLIRPSRTGNPKLKGLFHFTPPEAQSLPTSEVLSQRLPQHHSEGVTAAPGSQLGRGLSVTSALPISSTWTDGQGEIFHPDTATNEAWAQLLLACQGLIAFDTTVCYHGPGSSLSPRLATIALGPEGCQICHSAPENPLVFGQSPAHELPLLPPPPLYASSVKAAQSLEPKENKKFYARCMDCMKHRKCEMCNAWWCENCYTLPNVQSSSGPQAEIKVHMGFCVQRCLVEQLWSGAGEGGMWG
ncbi:MAG: hypothetical protein Q9188_003195 [Gyalolechia gomerana]